MSSSHHESSPDLGEEINILLLGESGVGKSTFINSCFNYLKYRTLKDVLNNDLQVLIRARIQMEDMHYEQKVIDLEVNDDQSEPDDVANEVLEDAKAATQDVRTYVFSIYINNKKYKIRFLDTPGMGDERGADQDQKNCDLILGYLSQLKEIHGFCILLKPTHSRLDVFMNYCIVQILSRLESSAVNNVVFVFTNTRGQNFTAGHTYTSLKVLLEKIKEVNKISIPLSRQNMFFFDNEAFRYVAAIKQGVELEPFIYGCTEQSWNFSSNEFWRLLYYVSHLNPHDLKKTISVNEARTMAAQLSQPVTEIVQLIQDNILKLQQHSNELSKAKITREELVTKMHTPVIDIIVEDLDYPHTVCTDRNCTSVYEINGVRKTHYKKKCCPNCYATFISPEIVGNIALYTCSAFGWNAYCKTCSHHLMTHQHIYYETEIIETKVNEAMLPEVNSQEELVKLKEDLIKNLSDRQQEYEHERQFILQSCAVFDQYLKKNSVTPIGTPIEDYLRYQITRESAFYRDPNDKTVNNLRNLLAEYEKEKAMVNIARSSGDIEFTPEEIEETKRKLVHLKHFGPKINRLYNSHQAGTKKAFKKREKVIRGGPGGFFKKFQDFFNVASSIGSVVQMGRALKPF